MASLLTYNISKKEGLQTLDFCMNTGNQNDNASIQIILTGNDEAEFSIDKFPIVELHPTKRSDQCNKIELFGVATMYFFKDFADYLRGLPVPKRLRGRGSAVVPLQTLNSILARPQTLHYSIDTESTKMTRKMIRKTPVYNNKVHFMIIIGFKRCHSKFIDNKSDDFIHDLIPEI